MASMTMQHGLVIKGFTSGKVNRKTIKSLFTEALIPQLCPDSSWNYKMKAENFPFVLPMSE